MLPSPQGRKGLNYFFPRGEGTKLLEGINFQGEKWTKLFFPLGRRGINSLEEKQIMFPLEANSWMFELKLQGVKFVQIERFFIP
jgi:hypothetical protein